MCHDYEYLAAQLSSTEPRQRKSALDALGETGAAWAYGLVLPAVEDPDGDVRSTAAFKALRALVRAVSCGAFFSSAIRRQARPR